MIGRNSAIALLLIINILQGCQPDSTAKDTHAIDEPKTATAAGDLAAKQTDALQESSVDLTLCQFSQGQCQLRFADLTLDLALTPEHAPSETPLSIKLTSSVATGAAAISDVSLRLEGRDMFMGIIPIIMKRISDSEYQGDFIYGSCSSHYMVWRLFVSVNVQGSTKSGYIDFLADSAN
ncbi:hypothetical protein [Shewanella sp. SR44-3]|uniref:hypothetical protein n=1 Tax=unclassified Shewanella TaxID=196818 RepID=UPI0015FC0A1B|nr:hypothetical protein [Shewanella sp. SR44-3]MBB1267749.1 hypothetical protein [Shewanella sp. SR44-3]